MFDGIHIVSHADDDGIDLVSWKMTPSQLAQIANHVRAQIVFLNSCRSLFMPQYLIDQHIPAVIAHTKVVGVIDRDALQLASYYYQELTRHNGDFHKAYDSVSNRDGTLSWSSNGAYLGIYGPIITRLDAVEANAKVQASTARSQARSLVAISICVGFELIAIISYVVHAFST